MNKLSIPSADFRVLLIQLVLRLVHRLARTLQPHTKRAELVDDLLESTLKLERELKRNVTLDVTRVHKRVLWDALFSNRLPEWLQVDLMDCLREEEVKTLCEAERPKVIADIPMYRMPEYNEHHVEPKEDLKEVQWDQLDPSRWYLEISQWTHRESYIKPCREWIGPEGFHYTSGYMSDPVEDFTYHELPKGMNFDD